ncbi:MAG: diadenylate cyclase, partial [Clostridia bacterium]|nr:diadenylate cyclase [Clostridia bacterium]
AFIGVSIACPLTKNNILYITSQIFNWGGIVLALFVVIAYQQDIKSSITRFAKWHDSKDSYDYGNSEDDLRQAIDEIVKGCQALSKNDTGALIVITPSVVPSHLLETGTMLNARISDGLLQCIFNTKAPLHDGAIIVKENVILAAGCFLPLSQREDISKELGTRHRAAIGITEESDVLAIVVSEETGIISTVRHGEIKRYMTPEKLSEEIEKAFGIKYSKQRAKKR